MSEHQPKPDSKSYSDLISEVKNGVIKVPKFQRDFVWSIDKTAQLLDSILKGYPIGTFILWQTGERMSVIKNIGNLKLPLTPKGTKVQYVLDGQQRITSLYAAYLGAEVQKVGETKVTDYSQIFVDLSKAIDDDDEQVITSIKPDGVYISLSDVLNSQFKRREIQREYSEEHQDKIFDYSLSFSTYDFSTVLLRRDNIESAIEVFTRINTGGQTLTLFEIMTARTYDEGKKFDMALKWTNFTNELADKNYEGISSSVILNLLSLILSKSKECKRKTILKLNKGQIIEKWDVAISSLKYSIDYFRRMYGIPVSQLLPYDTLLVPFAYFKYYNGADPTSNQRKFLTEFFWRASLSNRYSASTESHLAQDIRRIDFIINGRRPKYDDMNTHINRPVDLVNTDFRTGTSDCKAVLCLLAQKEPRDFKNGAKVILDNSYLIRANSKNYHHFFPKAFLRKQRSVENENSLMNITFISDQQNKRDIRAKAPSDYIGTFFKDNDEIDQALKSHFIDLHDFGIEDDNYSVFLRRRAERIFKEISLRLNPKVVK